MATKKSKPASKAPAKVKTKSKTVHKAKPRVAKKPAVAAKPVVIQPTQAKTSLGPRAFAGAALLILLATSIFWAVLSARLQNYNADELIDGDLFSSWRVFHAAIFPGAHTFLIKWPLFALSAVFGNTTFAVITLTVVCALLPIVALVALLAKMEKRPAVFGLWCLALASMLLLVPAQPAPGTLLPVNFAMLATRNIEYAVYLLVLVLLVRSKGWRDRRNWSMGILAALLIASDKLFLPLLVGAAALVLLWRYLTKPKAKWRTLIRLPQTRWLTLTIVGAAGAFAITMLLQHFQIVHVAGQSTTSPYQFKLGVKSLGEAIVYAGLALFTLFGANPAYAHLAISGWPQALQKAAAQAGSVAYAVNFVLLVTVILLGVSFLRALSRNKKAPGRAAWVSLLTVGSAITATIIYVATDHYYPADSRYLTIWFFALVLTAAIGLRSRALRPRLVALIAAVITLSLPFGIIGSYHQYQLSQQALQSQAAFQKAVADQIVEYNVGTLIGNYWDVTPIRSLANYQPAIVPLSDCTSSQSSLTSSAWQHAALGTSIGYLIDSHPPVVGFPDCSLDQVKQHFGLPTRQIAITSPGHGQSWLLIYDTGVAHLVQQLQRPSPKPTSTPLNLGAYQHCPQGTLLTVVAHEDDDILFTNPDLQHAITGGKCIATVFMTAGDAGSSAQYWQGREAGSEAAYATMYHRPDNWILRPRLVNGKIVHVASLSGEPQVALIFFNLPDGNVNGRGFRANNFESMQQLRTGEISAIATIDSSTTYIASQIIDSLATIMNTFQPDAVHTQDYSSDINDGDHSDHHATGYFTKQAFKQYGGAAELRSYIGYPGHVLPPNVTGNDLSAKEATFFTYALHDGATCSSMTACSNTAYQGFIPREYSRVDAEHAITAARIAVPPTTGGHGSGGGGCTITGNPKLIHCSIAP